MKRVSLLIVLFFITISTVAYASTTGNITLSTNKAEYNKGEEMVVDVKISNLASNEGVIALSAVLTYDKTNLQYKSIRGVGNWSNPSYNEDNGKLIVDRGSSTKNSETVFQVTFKVIANNSTTANISVSNVEVSGGAGAFNLSSGSKSVPVKVVNNSSSGTSGSSTPSASTPQPSNPSSSNTGSQTSTPSNSGSSTSSSSGSSSSSASGSSSSSNSGSSTTGSSSSSSNGYTTTGSSNSSKSKNKSPSKSGTINLNTTKNISNVSKENYSSKDLPKTGEESSLKFVIALGIMVSIISYVRLKQDKE